MKLQHLLTTAVAALLIATASHAQVARITAKPQDRDGRPNDPEFIVCVLVDGTACPANAGILGIDGSTIATAANPFPTRTVAGPTGGATPSHAIVAANTTSVAIDASPGTLFSVQTFNNSATIAYLKLYDAAQGSTTCGSGTPKKVIMIPGNTSGAGVVTPVGGVAGVAFATAITRCVTTGIADNDTGAPAASTYLVEADYK